MWDAATGRAECSAPDAAAANRGPVSSLSLLWGDRLAAGHGSGEVTLWRLPAGGGALLPAGRFDASHSGAVLSLAVLSVRRPAGDSGAHPRALASGGADAMIRLWDPDAPRALIQLKGHSGPVTGLAAVGVGALVSASADGSLRAWGATAMDAPQGFSASCRCLFVASGAVPGGARALCATSDGSFVFAAAAAGPLRLWRWDPSARKLAPRTPPEAAARVHAGGAACAVSVASPDGALVGSSAEGSGELRLWLSAPSAASAAWAPAPGGSAACAPFVVVSGSTASVPCVFFVCRLGPQAMPQAASQSLSQL